MTSDTGLSSKDLVSIEVGGAICLPIIMVGHKLVGAIGFVGSVAAIVLGNVILFSLALVAARMSFARKKNTPENARDYLGPIGVKVLAVVLFTAKCCWFALQLNLMSLTVIQLLEPTLSAEQFYLVNIVCGILIMAITMVGIDGVSHFSSLCLPLLIGTMIYSIVGADASAIQLKPVTFSTEAMALVIAAPITAVIDMPSYFSQSRSLKGSLIAVSVMFLVALPAVETVGVYLASANPSDSILEVFLQHNSPLWNLWISLFIILAAWTTNTTNLYSATICLGSIVRKSNHRQRCLATAALAIGISLFNILEHFTIFLSTLVVIVGSIGAVILSAYCWHGKEKASPNCQLANLAGGVAGALVGVANICQVFSLSGVAIVDAFCIAFAATALANNIYGVKQSKILVLENE